VSQKLKESKKSLKAEIKRLRKKNKKLKKKLRAERRSFSRKWNIKETCFYCAKLKEGIDDYDDTHYNYCEISPSRVISCPSLSWCVHGNSFTPKAKK